MNIPEDPNWPEVILDIIKHTGWTETLIGQKVGLDGSTINNIKNRRYGTKYTAGAKLLNLRDKVKNGGYKISA